MPFTKGQVEDIQEILNNHVKDLFKNEGFLNEIVKGLSNVILQKLSEEIDSLKTDIRSLKVQNEELIQTNHSLKQELDVQKVNLDRQEQYSRRNCIRIYGIPEDKGENTDDKVLSLFKNKMNLNVSIGDLDRTHRVGAVPGDKSGTRSKLMHRPIIVKFVSYQARNLVFSNKKLLKGTGKIIREDLTKIRLQLLKSAINKFGTPNVWTSDGRIIINSKNQKITITTQSELDKVCVL